MILDQEKAARRTACTAQSSAGWQSRPSSDSITATQALLPSSSARQGLRSGLGTRIIWSMGRSGGCTGTGRRGRESLFTRQKKNASRTPPSRPWVAHFSAPREAQQLVTEVAQLKLSPNTKHRPDGTASGAEEMEQACLDALPIPPRARRFHVLEGLTQPFSWSGRVLNLLRDGTHWNAWSHSRSGEIIARNSTT